ncbi:MAG: hypothetical protein KJN70_11965 [Eudoraea sp.]|nr:hypothetical protein [Eudoraea sp.]
MIKFFRKIRQRLLTENKFSKYIMYAIGEIALVVIGILIALQVNNWNENRKEEIRGDKLKVNLYQELLITHYHSKEVLKSYDFQIQNIDFLLSQGANLNIDSFAQKSQEYWSMENFSFITFLLFFTEPYDPQNKVYESSLSDGSIKYVNDPEFVALLEAIYTSAQDLIEDLYRRETTSNERIEAYISENHKDLFEGDAHIINGLWDDETIKNLIKTLVNDGALRFKLQQKNSILKSKRYVLQSQIIPNIETVIESHVQ